MGSRIEYKEGEILGSNNIIFLHDIEMDSYGHRIARFKCCCNKEFIYRLDSIKNDSLTSCGCIQRGKITHGYSYHPLYRKWNSIRDRCYNPKDIAYKYYGLKGISICDEWHNPKNFIEWASSNGWKPGLSIHRKDSDKDYTPDNCILLTKSNHARLHTETSNVK